LETNEEVHSRIGPDGKIVLPPQIVEFLRVKPGDTITFISGFNPSEFVLKVIKNGKNGLKHS
jgi:bifunctional DNA-binding transcriptional regulator/antitoxin component of YhaV-PrlF toxin-antitoxin module